MTPNTRAKILPALLLGFAPPLACYLPHAAALPFSMGYAGAVAFVTAIIALGLAGARDLDPMRTTFHRGAPAYWVPATLWLGTVATTALVLAIPGAPAAARWVLFVPGAIAALADLGTRVKNA